MRIVTLLLSLLLAVVGIVFAALNGQAVDVNYLVGTKSLPLAVMLLLSFSIGVFLTAVVLSWRLLRLKTKNNGLIGKLKQYER